MRQILGPRREIRVWKRLSHPNIVPLLGTTADIGFHLLPGALLPGMVSPWMRNGILIGFLEGEGLSVCERLKLVRRFNTAKRKILINGPPQLRDVAVGLAYRK